MSSEGKRSATDAPGISPESRGASERLPKSDRLIDGLSSLAAEQPVTLAVSGRSMEPTIPENSKIVVQPRSRYWPGDVLAFRTIAGELRVHRLIGYRWRGGRLLLQMRGDSGGAVDRPVPRDEIIGRVIGAPGHFRVPFSHRLIAVAKGIRTRLREARGR